jgi:hypothetical protein
MGLRWTNAFTAKIEIIGINPYIFIPEGILELLFKQADKDKGKIPVKMKIDGHEFPQTLVRYAGDWRLYLNMPMRKAAGKDVGDTAKFQVRFDPESRIVALHPKMVKALKENKDAKTVFDKLSPSLKHEIARYLSHLKTEESIDRNVNRAVDFLLGKQRFIGRDSPWL